MNRVLILIVFITITFCTASCSADKKKPGDKKDDIVAVHKEEVLDEEEAVKKYLNDINPVLVNVQMTSRNLSQRLLTLEVAIKSMQNCIDSMAKLNPPRPLLKEHKMIILSFKKMKIGFVTLLNGDRPTSLRLLKRGRELLRLAVNEILEFCKEKGLLPDKVKVQQQGTD